MKRIALLGATGSIGRQAVEIIDARPELELVAATPGSRPIDGLAPLTQVGGDPTELLERAQPDLVLNAVVGFAGLPVTLWALERGVDLALANKERLVGAGGGGAAARGWRVLAGGQRARGGFSVPGRQEPQTRRLACPPRAGGPVRGPDAR